MSMKSMIVTAIRWANSNIILKRIYPAIYRRAAKKAVDETKVIFLDEDFLKMGDSFALVDQRLKEMGTYQIHYWFLGKGRRSKRAYMKDSRKLIRDMATAKYVFLERGSELVSAVPMRRETIVTQLWHACGAFKKFGMSTTDVEFGKHLLSSSAHSYFHNITYCTVSSPEVIWAYEEAMQLQGMNAVRPVGVSRTDVYFKKETFEKAYEHVYQLFPQARGKKIILYAPTFRGKISEASTPRELDVEKMAEKLGGEYVLVIKHHPFVAKEKLPVYPSRCKDMDIFDASGKIAIEDLLCTADICMTDYSSLIFEYSLLERPMIFYAYDLEDYYDKRGFYYSYEDMAPGPVLRSSEEIVSYITQLPERFERQKVVDFRMRFMAACDGHATERILALLGISEKV